MSVVMVAAVVVVVAIEVVVTEEVVVTMEVVVLVAVGWTVGVLTGVRSPAWRRRLTFLICSGGSVSVRCQPITAWPSSAVIRPLSILCVMTCVMSSTTVESPHDIIHDNSTPGLLVLTSASPGPATSMLVSSNRAITRLRFSANRNTDTRFCRKWAALYSKWILCCGLSCLIDVSSTSVALIMFSFQLQSVCESW